MEHTTLGAGGSIGNALADHLLEKGEAVKLVSRRKHAIDGAQSVRGDLTSYSDTLEAVKGSDVVYLCVGLPYDSKIWKENWPKIMNNTINAWNQVWHLPTYSPAIYGKTFIRLATEELGVEPKYFVMTKPFMRMGKLFSKSAAESLEMMYQYEFPYHFDSSKFNTHFSYTPVSYEEGIKMTIDWMKNR